MTHRVRQRGFTMIEMIVTIGILAALAALAIPAYIRYIKRSRTTEVYNVLEKITVGAQTYFHTEHMDRSGLPLPRQFPDLNTVGRVPLTACCTQTGGLCGGSTPTDWTPFRPLSFSLDSPTHRYQYQFQSAGTDASSTFTASAFGNLDCDAIESTFYRTGEAVFMGATFEGNVRVDGVRSSNELE